MTPALVPIIIWSQGHWQVYSYQIYVFELVNNGVYGTCNLQRRCVRSTHARDTLNKFFGRQA